MKLFFHAKSGRIVPVVQLGVEKRSDPHRDFNTRATFSTNAFTPEVKRFSIAVLRVQGRTEILVRYGKRNMRLISWCVDPIRHY